LGECHSQCLSASPDDPGALAVFRRRWPTPADQKACPASISISAHEVVGGEPAREMGPCYEIDRDPAAVSVRATRSSAHLGVTPMSRCCVCLLFVAPLAWGGGAMLLGGCGSSCGLSGPVPLIVTISSATTGDVICDATVIAKGPFLLGNGPDANANSATLSQVVDAGTCEYQFAAESVTLLVSAPGFRNTTATGGGTYGCEGVPPPTHLNVALTPN
jgi:hypothetical protein